jgi:hypothetical protein
MAGVMPWTSITLDKIQSWVLTSEMTNCRRS